MTRLLRRRCPWDREQDAASIVSHTVEESYELADAIAAGDDGKMTDELGDVLFQVHFLSLMLEERGAGGLEAVADHCREKLIRRHPHVFGDAEAATAGEVLENWDRIKADLEGRAGDDPFADVPENLPALLHARKLQRRAASRLGGAGLEAGHLEAAARARDALARLGALSAEGADARPATEAGRRREIEESVGEALFQVVDAARRLGCDPELALRRRSQEMRA